MSPPAGIRGRTSPTPGSRPVDAQDPGAIETLWAEVAPAAVVLTAALARVLLATLLRSVGDALRSSSP